MRGRTVVTIERMPGEHTRIVFTSYPLGGRAPIADASVEFDKDQVRKFVVDLCEKAGLDRPW